MLFFPSFNSRWLALAGAIRDGRVKLAALHIPRPRSGDTEHTDVSLHLPGMVGLAISYVVLDKLGQAVALLNPSAIPVWPPSGLALAAVLLWGRTLWPALFVAALTGYVSTTGSLSTAAAIAIGNTLEAVIGGALIGRWSQGVRTFETPSGVAKFALFSLAPGAMISATMGVGGLYLFGSLPPGRFWSVWMTWWLGDAVGVFVVTPVLVHWVQALFRAESPVDWRSSAIVLAATLAIGLLGFGPLFEQTITRGPVAFLTIGPVLWAAVRCSQRDTATAVLILSSCAVWGTLSNTGPFAHATRFDAYLLVLMFMTSSAVFSMVLNAEVRVRMGVEATLRQAQQELDHRVRDRTAALAEANHSLEHQRVHLVEAQRLAKLGSFTLDIPAATLTLSAELISICGLDVEAVPRTFEDFLVHLHEDDRAVFKNQFTPAQHHDHDHPTETRIVRPDGGLRHLRSSAELIKDEQGSAMRMLGVCQDVTDLKTAEAVMSEYRRELYHLGRVATAGEMATVMAHELNQPLAAIALTAHACARLAATGNIERSELREHLSDIEGHAKRAGEIIRQTRNYVRKAPESKTLVDLHRVITDVVRLTEPFQQRLGVDIVIARTDVLPRILGVEVQLVQLLLNLVRNAEDAVAGNPKSDRRVRISTHRADADHVMIEVEDNGRGIPAEFRDRLFEPFFTTRKDGLGVGLAISKTIAEAHDAILSFESRDSGEHRGTTFRIIFPACPN